MAGIDADATEAARGLEVPLGLGLDLHLPPAAQPWQPVGSPPELEVQALEPGEGGTTVHLVAVGLGRAVLRFEAGEARYEVPVEVLPPLFND